MERGVFDLEIHEDILYVSNYFFGVIILNVSDPLNPRIISSLGETLDADDPPRSRAVSGDNNFLAIAKMERGVSFVDVSDPTKPYELALYNESRPTNCLYDGKYVYITDSDTSRSFQIVEFITEEPLKDTQNHWYLVEFVSILFLVIITVTSFLLIVRSKFFRKS
jgi:hypothetical protein